MDELQAFDRMEGVRHLSGDEKMGKKQVMHDLSWLHYWRKYAGARSQEIDG